MASLGIRGKLLVDEQPQHEDKQEGSQECGSESQISYYFEEISHLQEKIRDMEACHKNQIDMLQREICELKKSSFSIQNAKENKMLHFYTGLPDNETFESLFNYLGPAVNNLVYCGSNTAGDKINSETYVKRGPKRALSPRQELFVLSRLRCGLLEKHLAFCLGISAAHVSRISTTWIDFCIQDSEPFQFGHQDKK